MAKTPQSIKSHKEGQIKAPLRYFSHVKVKKQKELENVLEEESRKPCVSNAKGYSVKILKDRVELVADKNAKKPPVKKIKFSHAKRFIQNEENLCICISSRQGNNAAVTSFGFTENSAYAALLNYLNQTSGLAGDSTNQADQPVKKTTKALPQPQKNTKMNTISTENKPAEKGINDTYATSYTVWDEMEFDNSLDSANSHRPGSGTSCDSTSHGSKFVVDSQDEIFTEQNTAEEVQHCPCCLQRSGINLKFPSHGHRDYASSSTDSKPRTTFPAHLPHRYKCYRPRPLKFPITRESSTYSDESSFESLDDSELTEFHPQRRRYRSQPPPIMFRERVEVPVRPWVKYQPPKYPRKVKLRTSRSAHQTWSAESSTSSGYTSATLHEDDLKLTVDTSTGGHYIRNKKLLATGRVGPATKKPQMYHYQRNISSLPHFRRLRA